MTDLVERLREPASLHYNAETVNAERREAATALEAKDAEIAALKERLSEQTRMIQNDHDLRRADISRIQTLDARLKSAEARAETAEQVFDDILDELGCERNNEAALEAIATLRRKLAEARAALKPFSDAAESLSEDHLDRMDLWESPAGMDITAGQLRAARAVIEKE